MNYRTIDMNAYPRLAHFTYFKSMRQPYVGLTVNVDITNIREVIRQKKLPFFLTVLYAASRAANQVRPLRQRIAGEGIVEYDACDTSHTVALPDGTYCYCRLNSSMPFEQYLIYARERLENAKTEATLDDGEDSDSLLFVSSIPWVSYTALIQPTPEPADSNPRITFGRYYEEAGQVLLPVTLLANHAVVDGKDIAAFYDSMNLFLEKLVCENA